MKYEAISAARGVEERWISQAGGRMVIYFLQEDVISE